jgi:tetratricopeptide (TPR) repeat protein
VPERFTGWETAGVPFAADDLGAWLVGLLADAGRKKLTTLVLGTDQERALRSAATAAVQRTAGELRPDDEEQAEHVAMVISQVFGEPVPGAALAGDATVLEVLQAGIAGQLAVLDDASLTGTGQSSADVLEVPGTVLAAKLTAHLLREIVARGARGGPLFPLASQLNDDVTHLQSQRLEGMLALLINVVLEALARLEGGTSVELPAVVAHTLPADVASFTGRQEELDRLMRALPSSADPVGVVRIDAIDGMAGVGKTAFAVHAAHQLASRFPDGQLFVRLHAHTPGQQPVGPADALAALLLGDGVAPRQIPAGLEARAGLWRDRMAGRRFLLVLDDATGHEQVRPLLPGTAGNLVLVTSRRHLTGLEDAQAISLDIMSADEAAELLIRLAAQPGLSSDDVAVREIARLCGYLPLAVGILARQLAHHPAWTTTALAADLAAVRDRLELMQAENLSVAAAFDLSYQDLTLDQQRLFRRLGLHPGSDVDAYAAAAMDDIDLSAARRRLEALYDQHLLTEPAHGRYRMHDLIRAHARALAAMDQIADGDTAIDRLLDYYLYTATAAGRDLAWNTPESSPAISSPPTFAPDLLTREQKIAWLDAERANLQAATDYAALRTRPVHAIGIPFAIHGFLRTNGHWDQALALHRTALVAARRIGDRSGQASAICQLGAVHRLAGDYPAALISQNEALTLYRDLGDRPGEGDALTELGTVRWLIGEYLAADATLGQALELWGELCDPRGEADVLCQLGTVQRLTGDHVAALDSQAQALQLYRDLGDRLGEADALRNLGDAHYANGDYPAAATCQAQALELYRDLGSRPGEADALRNLGTVQRSAGDYLTAAKTLSQALRLYRGLGDRRGEAEALNDLGELVSDSSGLADACAHHESALIVARNIGSPLEESRALEGIGRCVLGQGETDEGAIYLRHALAIYQRIGSPNTQRVEIVLSDYRL